MKSDRFNKLLKEYKTNYDSCQALLDTYYPYIMMRTIRRYGSKELGHLVAQYFFGLLEEAEITRYVENPAIWVHNICDSFIKQNYVQTPSDDNETVIELCKFAFGEEQFEKIENCDAVTLLTIVMNTCEGFSLDEIAQVLGMETVEIEEKFSFALQKANEAYSGVV